LHNHKAGLTKGLLRRGGQLKDHYIYIDGKRLAITKNCSELLYNFRNPGRREANSKRRLWVDSICINQQDEEEKCAQVEMMQQIYQRSSQVLIWLGPATPESDLLFQTIRKITWQWWNPWRSKKKGAQIMWDVQLELMSKQSRPLAVSRLRAKCFAL
jgi:hypothetical protein